MASSAEVLSALSAGLEEHGGSTTLTSSSHLNGSLWSVTITVNVDNDGPGGQPGTIHTHTGVGGSLSQALTQALLRAGWLDEEEGE